MHTTLVPEPIKLTYQDYCALPDDGRRYEILDGDLYMSPAPETPHQRVAFRLAMILHAHVARRGLGEVFIAPLDVLLDEHDVVEPDIIFVSKARRSIITQKNIQGAPDLLVEVMSPSSGDRDTRDKRNLYARCGVPFYWLVDPDARSITELELVETAYAEVGVANGASNLSPKLFPGLQIQLEELWE